MIDKTQISKMFTLTPSVEKWIVRKLVWLPIVALLFFNFASKFLDLFQLDFAFLFNGKHVQVQEGKQGQHERHQDHSNYPTQYTHHSILACWSHRNHIHRYTIRAKVRRLAPIFRLRSASLC